MELQPIVKWLNKELSALLECEIGDEYSKYFHKHQKNIKYIFNYLYLQEYFKH